MNGFRAKFSRISVILPAVMVLLTFLASLSVGVIGYFNGQAGLQSAVETQVQSLARARGQLLDFKLENARAEMDVLASSESALLMAQAMMPKPKDGKPIQEKTYFSAPATPAERRSLDGSQIKTAYSFLHRDVHPVLASSLSRAGYGDIYVLNLGGDVIYSVNKAGDFFESALEGDLSQSPIGQMFAALKDAPEGNQISSDFAIYAYGTNNPTMFMAQPIYELKGPSERGFAGMIAFRLDVDFFNSVLSDREGMGETGQIFMANTDGVVLSDMPRSAEPTALVATRPYQVLNSAESGQAFGIEPNAVDGDMMVAVSSLHFLGANWYVVAERTVEESLSAVREMAMGMFIGTLIVLGVASGIAILFSRWITVPIGRLTSTMRALAGGDLDVEVRGADRTNELGDMAQAVEVFRENGIKVADMTEEEAKAAERHHIERADMMKTLQFSFGEVVDAAIAGDFTKRVEATFPDAELNTLAGSVNSLVETVDRGLSESGAVLSALADTDLTQRVSGDYQGAFLALKTNTNRVSDKLIEVVLQLRETSRGVKKATGEILSGSNDLSERTTKQAATIEQTSAAMEQLAVTVLGNANKAHDASGSAQNVSQTAEEGAEVMSRANGAMEQITSSSSKISNIIGMIDDIAFQTNLLALNASVEAARAGEAGKGFAVVAVEVRRLAQSAAEASSEVKVLIEQSASEVGEGSKLVAEAAQKLSIMLDAARTSNQLMEAIAEESREQASSIEEVNASVRQLDEMTQHNAALVEETNAAIEQTEAQASELDRIVDIFRVDGHSDGGSAARQADQANGITGLRHKVISAA